MRYAVILIFLKMASSSITRVEHVGQSARGMDADAQSIDSDVHEMYAQDDNPNQIVTMAPKEAFRLGYFDVMCLVVNFMIGKSEKAMD